MQYPLVSAVPSSTSLYQLVMLPSPNFEKCLELLTSSSPNFESCPELSMIPPSQLSPPVPLDFNDLANPSPRLLLKPLKLSEMFASSPMLPSELSFVKPIYSSASYFECRSYYLAWYFEHCIRQVPFASVPTPLLAQVTYKNEGGLSMANK